MMNVSKNTVLSHVRDEVRPAKHVCNEKGVRYWSAVEIRGERWFQIESCFHSSGEPEVRTFIVKDFQSASALLPQLRGSSWTSLRLYSRAPLLRSAGFVFEAIDKVFELKTGTLMFVLESGTVLFESECALSDAEPLFNAKEMYSRR